MIAALSTLTHRARAGRRIGAPNSLRRRQHAAAPTRMALAEDAALPASKPRNPGWRIGHYGTD